MAELALPHDGSEFRREREFDSELISNPNLDFLLFAMLDPDKLGIRRPENYATARIEDAINWQDVYKVLEDIHGIPRDENREWHVTGFRSHRKESADSEKLDVADIAAFREAMYASCDDPEAAYPDPKFIFYYRGGLQENGRCLSICLWTDKPTALQATQGPNRPAHQYARSLALEMYDLAEIESYTLERSENGTKSVFTETAPKRDLFEYVHRYK